MKKYLGTYFKNFGFLKHLPNKFEISEGVIVSVGRKKESYLYKLFKKNGWNRNKKEIS